MAVFSLLTSLSVIIFTFKIFILLVLEWPYTDKDICTLLSERKFKKHEIIGKKTPQNRFKMY